MTAAHDVVEQLKHLNQLIEAYYDQMEHTMISLDRLGLGMEQIQDITDGALANIQRVKLRRYLLNLEGEFPRPPASVPPPYGPDPYMHHGVGLGVKQSGEPRPDTPYPDAGNPEEGVEVIVLSGPPKPGSPRTPSSGTGPQESEIVPAVPRRGPLHRGDLAKPEETEDYDYWYCPSWLGNPPKPGSPRTPPPDSAPEPAEELILFHNDGTPAVVLTSWVQLKPTPGFRLPYGRSFVLYTKYGQRVFCTRWIPGFHQLGRVPKPGSPRSTSPEPENRANAVLRPRSPPIILPPVDALILQFEDGKTGIYNERQADYHRKTISLRTDEDSAYATQASQNGETWPPKPKISLQYGPAPGNPGCYPEPPKPVHPNHFHFEHDVRSIHSCGSQQRARRTSPVAVRGTSPIAVRSNSPIAVNGRQAGQYLSNIYPDGPLPFDPSAFGPSHLGPFPHGPDPDSPPSSPMEDDQSPESKPDGPNPLGSFSSPLSFANRNNKVFHMNQMPEMPLLMPPLVPIAPLPDFPYHFPPDIYIRRSAAGDSWGKLPPKAPSGPPPTKPTPEN